MTDKIIIDGVDVSGCKLYDKTTHKLDFNKCGHVCKDTECKYKRFWYKKQLQRKTQECEELNKKMSEVIYRATGGMLSYSTYTLDAIEDAFNNMVRIQVDQETECLRKENNSLAEQTKHHKQTLEEIEKVLDKTILYNGFQYEKIAKDIGKILNIINEVKNDSRK